MGSRNASMFPSYSRGELLCCIKAPIGSMLQQVVVILETQNTDDVGVPIFTPNHP